MSLAVRTARLSYRGRRPTLNVTRKFVTDQIGKTGKAPPGAPFAPSWAILQPSKAGTKRAQELLAGGYEVEAKKKRDEVWRLYRQLYFAEMLVSSGRPAPAGWERNVEAALRHGVRPQPEAWNELLARPEIVLLCYCTDPEHCHRTLLAGVLQRLGAEFFGEVKPYVVLGTGSRHWATREPIEKVIHGLPPDTFIVHGAGRGADLLIDDVAKLYGFGRKAYPADWSLYEKSGGEEGRFAGPKRNGEMLAAVRADLQEGCAFGRLVKENSDPTGTGDMVRKLRAAEIPVLWTPATLVEPLWLDEHLPARLAPDVGAILQAEPA